MKNNSCNYYENQFIKYFFFFLGVYQSIFAKNLRKNRTTISFCFHDFYSVIIIHSLKNLVIITIFFMK